MRTLNFLLNTLTEMVGTISYVDKDGEGHWSGTLAVMKGELGRRLTDNEITVLSLSRNFGPTPSLTDEEARKVLKHLWPEGNSNGHALDWHELRERLTGFCRRPQGGWDIRLNHETGKYEVCRDTFATIDPPISYEEAVKSADRANRFNVSVAEFFNL